MLRSFVGDTRRVGIRVLDASRVLVPLAGTVTCELVNTDTSEASDAITVTKDSTVGNFGSLDIPTPTAGKFRLTLRMVSGGLTTTAGPLTVLVSER